MTLEANNRTETRGRKPGLLTSTICRQVQEQSEGTVVSAKEFLHLGTRANVDQALSRLARSGHLVRVSRGLYARPVETRFGTRSPSVESVIRSIERHTGEQIVSTGAAAANELSLTTQVPVREVFLTSGSSRNLTIGNRVVELRHAPLWQVRPGVASSAVRALMWLGEEAVEEAAEKLNSKLSKEEKREMIEVASSAHGQFARVIGKHFSDDTELEVA